MLDKNVADRLAPVDGADDLGVARVRRWIH
jgi:hypothetical protein